MKTVRKIIEIDEEKCDGCGQCILACAEGALELVDGKAKVVSDNYCDGLGACIGECPQGALRIVERKAEEFDPEAVEEYLKEKEKEQKQTAGAPSGAICPSARVQVFESSCASANEPVVYEGGGSALTHWPVQIRLVPPTAPFLKNAHLLVAADCVPVAYPRFHSDLLQGKVVLLGCPKFDDVREYVKRFEEIFRQAGIRSVTTVEMEVPCCSALASIVKKGMAEAGKTIPMEEIVVGSRGDIVERRKSAA